MGDPQAVLEFWFGTPGGTDWGIHRREWFAKDEAFDRIIAQRFGPLIAEALAGRLASWALRPELRLARILLLDQFTRNAFRGTPAAFSGDPMALADALALVEHGDDHTLPPLQRSFAYMPFEHAEDRALQGRSVQLFEALAEAHAGFESQLDYARRHHDVIERFGRFPHRNEILGRPSSDAEKAFLARPGSGF